MKAEASMHAMRVACKKSAHKVTTPTFDFTEQTKWEIFVFTCLSASTQEYLRNPFVLARTPAAKED
jgi:hypothetical protein